MGIQINLTPGRVADYECIEGKNQSFLWDNKSRCLALRATQNGAKAYIFQAKLHGKDIRINLGSPNAWTVQDVRETANRFKVSVDQGIDLRLVAAQAKATAAAHRVGTERAAA